jgi:hypothetical protein
MSRRSGFFAPIFFGTAVELDSSYDNVIQTRNRINTALSEKIIAVTAGFMVQ